MIRRLGRWLAGVCLIPGGCKSRPRRSAGMSGNWESLLCRCGGGGLVGK